MAFPASTLPSLGTTLQNLQSLATGIKVQAQNAVITLQSGSVTSIYIFQMLDQLGGVITLLNAGKNLTGLDAFATVQCPGYVGTLSADITTAVNAAQAVINWIVANFPTDTGGFLQAFKLNADGSRTPTSFSSVQTAGLVTAIQALISAIG